MRSETRLRAVHLAKEWRRSNLGSVELSRAQRRQETAWRCAAEPVPCIGLFIGVRKPTPEGQVV
jgi:hypothetical protein